MGESLRNLEFNHLIPDIMVEFKPYLEKRGVVWRYSESEGVHRLQFPEGTMVEPLPTRDHYERRKIIMRGVEILWLTNTVTKRSTINIAYFMMYGRQ